MNRKIGNMLILLGLLLLLGAGGLAAYNIWDGIRAARASQHIIDELNIGQDLVEALDREPDQDSEMPVIEVDGYNYIGILEIPSLELTLPVMDRWDYSRLKISPCVYSGSYKTDDLVICAHNYQKHFSPIKGIAIDADVYFITAQKVIYHYKVCNRETVKPTAVDQMIRNWNNGDPEFEQLEDWDLTLFTCNTGGQTRCAVRCIRAE